MNASRSLLAVALLLLSACDAEHDSLASRKKVGGSHDDAPPPGQVTDPTSGATVPPVVGGPGTSQPPQPGGYQLTVAPLMDKNGCTECHHAGRTINLMSYPFMAGSSADTAARLSASIGATGTMPPAPRSKPDAALMAAIDAWQANGGKP